MTQEEEKRVTLQASAALKAAEYWAGQAQKAREDVGWATLQASASLKAAGYWSGQVQKARRAAASREAEQDAAEQTRRDLLEEWQECLRTLRADKEGTIGANGDV